MFHHEFARKKWTTWPKTVAIFQVQRRETRLISTRGAWRCTEREEAEAPGTGGVAGVNHPDRLSPPHTTGHNNQRDSWLSRENSLTFVVDVADVSVFWVFFLFSFRFHGAGDHGGLTCSHLQSYDPDRALTDYISRLEALQRRLGSVTSGTPWSELSRLDIGYIDPISAVKQIELYRSSSKIYTLLLLINIRHNSCMSVQLQVFWFFLNYILVT